MRFLRRQLRMIGKVQQFLWLLHPGNGCCWYNETRLHKQVTNLYFAIFVRGFGKLMATGLIMTVATA